MRMPSTDDRRGQLGANPELVADVHEQRRHQDVEDERDDEDLRVEDVLEIGLQTAEHRVEGGDDGDRQVGCTQSGTLTRKTRPSTMPAIRAAIPIIGCLPSACRANVKRPARRGRQGDVLFGADLDPHPVRGLQQA